MVSLVRYGGKLLRRGGVLARGVNCCCDVDPPPCPNCCISIGWGSFDGTGDLILDLTDFVVKVVMPTKNSRLVCDGDSIEIRMEIADPDTFVGRMYVTWDRHWDYETSTPAVGTDGRLFDDGMIEWGEVLPMVEVFSVTLSYNHCWADNVVQYGDIEAGDRDRNFTLIDGENCSSSECCEPQYICDDCCFFIGPDDNTAISYELNDQGHPVFWVANNVGDRMKLTVEGTDNGLVCIPGAEVVLKMDMIPLEYTGAEWAPVISVAADGGWEFVSASPSIGTGTIVTGPDPIMDVTWGVEIEDFEFSLTTAVACPYLPDSLVVSFDRAYGSTTPNTGASIRIDFTCCPTFSCDNCYPPVYTQYFFVEVSESDPYVDLSSEVPPLTDCGELYYHGRVRDTTTEPYGSLYWTHLWLVKACFWEEDGSIGQQELDYADVLQTWGNGLVAFLTANVGVPNVGDIADFYVDGMKADKLTTPSAPDELLDDLIDITPTPCEQCREDCDP